MPIVVLQEMLGTYAGDINKVFKALDVNGDGQVSMQEWKALFVKMQQGLGVAKVLQFVKMLEESQQEQSKVILDQVQSQLVQAKASLEELQLVANSDVGSESSSQAASAVSPVSHGQFSQVQQALMDQLAEKDGQLAMVTVVHGFNIF